MNKASIDSTVSERFGRLPPALTECARCLGVLEGSCTIPPVSDDEILAALRHPLWLRSKEPALLEMIGPGDKTCIAISDHTRKTALDRVLPVFLSALLKLHGTEDIFLLVASGIHRHPEPFELRRMLGVELARRFEGRIFMHDPDDAHALVQVGKMRCGHEVSINRRAVEADRLILTGAASYHYHAGFGGGRKSLVPGLADRNTIAYTHSLTLDPLEDRIRAGVEPGLLDANPVSEAFAEAAMLHPPDFIINTVLRCDGSLAGVFAGEMNAAHRAACRLTEQLCRVDLAEQADLTIASAGSASNWIQSHKALFSAHRTIRAGGKVILIAPCHEGLGDERFRHWITQKSTAEICAGLRQSAEVLGQTALSTMSKRDQTILVTDLDRRDQADLGLSAVPDLDTAIGMALEHFRECGISKPSYYLMPNAASVMPFFTGSACEAAAASS